MAAPGGCLEAPLGWSLGVPPRLAAQGGRFVGSLGGSLEGHIGERDICCNPVLQNAASPYTVCHFVEFESDIGSDRLAESKLAPMPFDDF